MTADLSQEQRLALLPKEQREAILAELDMDVLAYDWGYQGRPSQKLDLHEPWSLAAALAGRGFGKTLMGSQWIRQLDTNWQMLQRDQSHMRFCLLGRTAGAVRDVMLEGPSGIMNIWPPSVRDRVIWTPSRRRIELPNGSVGLCFSGEEPDQLRGPAFHIGWCVAEGTMIRTAGGELPVETIESGDRVWTRDGLRPVTAAGMTGTKEVMLLRTADGHELRASADHRVWTDSGWKFMRDVVLCDKVYAWTNPAQDHQHGSNGMASSGTGTPRMATTEMQVVGHSSTLQSGSVLTADSRTDTRFITSTMIEATTASPTSKRAQSKITGATTHRNEWSKIPAGTSRSHLTPVEQELTGSGKSEKQSRSLARDAAPYFSPRECAPSSAHQIVLQPLAVTSVEKISGSVRTYDLTVAGSSEYFADGILVHNCDELAAFKQLRSAEGEATAWQNLRIGVRLGTQPQILVTTTPKRVPVIKEILSEAAEKPKQVLMRRGKTVDNKYLSEAYLDVLFSLYGGTALGRQELEGEVLDDVVGAMASEAAINEGRVANLPAGIPWIRLIGVDPSVAERPHDECGIVVVYISNTWPIERRHAFVVDDLSMRANPATWGKVLVKAAYEHQATIIAETNQGSNLVQQLIRMSADDAGLPIPPVRDAWSSKAKSVRSEPIGAAYARGRVHHVNVHADLESQITSWVPGESGYSPDRMDALVHACAAGLFRRALVNGMPGSAAIRSSAKDHLQIPKETATLSRRDARSGLFSKIGLR